MRATHTRTRTLTVHAAPVPATPPRVPEINTALAALAVDLIRRGIEHGKLYLDARGCGRVVEAPHETP